MAKLYKYPEGDCFYDAFGGKIGEVEEVWAGDNFNRCSVTSNSTAGRISACSDSFVELARSTNDTATSFYATKDDVNAAIYQLAELQKQIDELSDKIKVDNKLRTELHTLRYKREVV